MSTWISYSEDDNLPSWLKDNISKTCKYCGSEMLHHYNDGGRCTNRKCSNPMCPGFLAAKMDYVRKLIGVQGIGFKTCLKDIQTFGVTSQFKLLNMWGYTPTVTIGKFLRMHCFEGVDSEWDNITIDLGIYTLDELYDKYDGKWKQLLLDNKELIYSNAQYVNFVKKPATVKADGPWLTLVIMITGTPIGYRSKNHFIDILNELCKGIIVIRQQATAKQSGVDALIREPGSTTKGKYTAAVKGNIPILTSEQFIWFLAEMMNRYNSEVNNKQ